MKALERFVAREQIERLGQCCGLVERRRVISGPVLVEAALSICSKARVSLESWACAISVAAQVSISKQAVHQRFSSPAVEFFRSVVGALLLARTRADTPVAAGHWSRILVHDSTIVTLPERLADCFPGSANQSGHRWASVRIQTVLELVTERLCHLSIEPYARNDQAASADIIQIARRGDLVLRDLGYFTLKALAAMQQEGICFISRLRTDVNLYELQGEPLDLLAVLRRMGEYDGPLLVGAKQRLPVRLVALRVPKKVGAARRRRMRKDRDKRLRPGRKSMALQDWDIFITNVGAQQLSAGQLARLYWCRWRIETVFKTFKAGLKGKAIEPTASAQQALILLYAHLLRAGVILGPVWELLRQQASRDGTRLSLQKTSRFLQQHLGPVLRAILRGDIHHLKRLLQQHCSYDRRARPTYTDRFAELCSELSNPTPLHPVLALT